MSWVELDGPWWSWVHGFIIPNENHIQSDTRANIVTNDRTLQTMRLYG